MKIAIPTNNGLTIASGIIEAKGFLVLTVEKNIIIQEDLRWNDQGAKKNDNKIIIDKITDCDFVIVNELDKCPKEELIKMKKEYTMTRETIIINAFVEFLNETLRKEANYCCCP